jgi:predicted metal-dependent hydrolase
MKGEFVVPGIGSIKIRRGVHIKILSVRMAAGRGVWINIPCGVSDREAERFLLSQREKISGQLEKLKVHEKETGVGLGIDTEVKCKCHVLKILSTPAEEPYYHREGAEVRLYIPEKTVYERVAPFVERFLVEIYKHECRLLLPKRVQELARVHGFTYNRLGFRDNLSNWGSCSAEDNISLNVKLMKLPDELIDYVILHELCHTVEKNHSVRFWALMQRVCPDYARRRKELKTFNTRV